MLFKTGFSSYKVDSIPDRSQCTCASRPRCLVSGWYKHCKFVWVSSGRRENVNTSWFRQKLREKLSFSFRQVLNDNLLHISAESEN